MIAQVLFGLIGLACVATEVWGVREFLITMEGGFTYMVAGGCLVAGSAPLCPAAARVLWAQSRPVASVAAWVVFGLCLLVVMVAAVSRTGTAADAAQRLRDQATRAEQLAIADVRDAEAALTRAVGEADRECATGRGSGCRDAEAKADKARSDLTDARKRLAAAPAAEADPLANRIAALTPLSVDQVQLIQPLILPAALFGLGTIFLTAAASPMPARVQPIIQTPAPIETPAAPITGPSKPMSAPKPAKPTTDAKLLPAPGGVSRFMLERLEPSPGDGVPVQTVLAEYDAWCAGKGLEPLNRERIIQELKRLFDAAGLETAVEDRRVMVRDVALKAAD